MICVMCVCVFRIHKEQPAPPAFCILLWSFLVTHSHYARASLVCVQPTGARGLNNNILFRMPKKQATPTSICVFVFVFLMAYSHPTYA